VLCEGRAPGAGGNEVRADVAERPEPTVPLHRREAAEPAARDVLEEDALDGVLRAEREDLLHVRHHQHAFIVTH
jgi:hypothetical protein